MPPVNMQEKDSYVIFSSHLPKHEVESILQAHWIGFKVLRGKYKGKEETSYIANTLTFYSSHVMPLVEKQEAILLLGPMTRDGRQATVIDLVTDKRTALGYFKAVPEDFALAQDSYTYDMDKKEYYVAI